MKSSRIANILAAAGLCCWSVSAAAQDTGMYVVVSAHIDNVENPTDIFQTAADCKNNPVCAGALAAISSSTGYPIDKATTALAAFSTSRAGEGSDTFVALPSGYRYCSAQFNLTSIVPHGGARGSTLFLEAREENGKSGVNVETWTPRLPLGQGRSWVEGNLVVVGVQADRAESAYGGATPCHRAAPRRAFFVCRGAGCEGAMADKGTTVATSPTGADERRP